MKKGVFFVFSLNILLILLNTAGTVKAAEEIQMPPRTEIPINLRLLDREKKTLTGEKLVMVEVSRGGLKEPAVLSSGLLIRDGIGHFVYITPSVSGPAEVKIVDPKTREVLKKIVFVITEPARVSWKEETVLATEIVGRVSIKPGSRTLRFGEELTAGVMVTTGANSWLNLELFDGSRLIMQPGSVLRLVAMKRGFTLGEKECRLNLISGRIFIVAQDYREKSAVFQVRTPDAAVYAHGTVFEVNVSDRGTEAVAYQGEVILEDVERGFLFPVAQGQKALLPVENGAIPEYSFHGLTPEIREDILRGEGFLTKERIPQRTNPSTSQYLIAGALTIKAGLGKENDAVLLMKPQFYNIANIGLSFGLGLPFVLNQTTGKLRFGDDNPNIKVGSLVDWIKAKNGGFYLDYDYQKKLTYGFGLLFGDYESEAIRRTRFGLRGKEGLCIEVLCPWNIRSIYPWKLDSASLYASRIEDSFNLDRFSLQLGLTYVIDNSIKNNLGSLPVTVLGITDQGVAIDAGLFLAKAFQPYIEGAMLKDFGYGIEAGAFGQVGPFRYRGAYRYLGDKFHPNYFGTYYDSNKINTLLTLFSEIGEDPVTLLYGKPLAKLNDPVYKIGWGYLVGLGVSAGEILSLELLYEDTNREDQYFPILTGRLEFALPPLGPIPALSAGFDYRCYQYSKINDLVNTNTIYSNYIDIILYNGVCATLRSTYLPFFNNGSYLRELSLEVRIHK